MYFDINTLLILLFHFCDPVRRIGSPLKGNYYIQELSETGHQNTFCILLMFGELENTMCRPTRVTIVPHITKHQSYDEKAFICYSAAK